MNLIKTTLLISVLALTSCNNSKEEKAENLGKTLNIQNNDDQPIVLIVDGKTRTISANERVKDTINFNEHPVKTLFRKTHTGKDGNQFEINLNFYEKDILDKLPITYNLPQDNYGGTIKIDLNFFDYEREVEKSMNRRLIFEDGTLTIHELNKDKIRFDFNGIAHELMNNEHKSAVSGRVNVQY